MVSLSDGVVSLRPWTRRDAGFLARAGADPAIRRYNGALDREGRPPPPPSIVEAEAVIGEWRTSWQTFEASGTPTGGTVFAVVEDATGELVGCCGVDDWSKADVAQFGYWLAPEARGRGCATRSVILMTRWLFDLGAARVFLTIVAGNDASAEVARRAGFVHEATLRAHAVWDGERCDVWVFAALPLEWPLR